MSAQIPLAVPDIFGLEDSSVLLTEPRIDDAYLDLIGPWRVTTKLVKSSRQFDIEAGQFLKNAGLESVINPSKVRWVEMVMEVWRCGLQFAFRRSNYAIVLIEGYGHVSLPMIKETYDEMLKDCLRMSSEKLAHLLSDIGFAEVLQIAHGAHVQV